MCKQHQLDTSFNRTQVPDSKVVNWDKKHHFHILVIKVSCCLNNLCTIYRARQYHFRDFQCVISQNHTSLVQKYLTHKQNLIYLSNQAHKSESFASTNRRCSNMLLLLLLLLLHYNRFTALWTLSGTTRVS